MYGHQGEEGQELWFYFRKHAIHHLSTPWPAQRFFWGEVNEIRCSLQFLSSWKKLLRGCFRPEDSVTFALQAVGLLYGRSTN